MPEVLPPSPLQSQWGGLNENLICTITPIDREGVRDKSEPEVRAPMMEGATLSGQPNWQSPFENLSPDSKAPALVALVQSGALSPLVAESQPSSPQGGAPAQLQRGLAAGISSLKGRSGVTRMNSTQIFSGMTPLKVSCTLLFRAWKDPVAEVMEPLRQLWAWAVPQKLAPDSPLVAVLSNGVSGIVDLLGSPLLTLLPSEAPKLVQFRYGGRLFDRMVIESIEEPLTSSRDRNGNYVELALSLTFATLTALDREDMAAHFRGESDPRKGERS